MVDNTPDEVLAGLQLDAHVTGLAYAPEGHCLYTVATSSPLGGEGGSSRHRRFREFVVLHAQIKQSLQLGPFPLTRFRGKPRACAFSGIGDVIDGCARPEFIS